MNESEFSSTSIALRVRRTTVEFAYVRVLVTSEVMKADAAGKVITDDKGHARLDMDKLMQRGIELARVPGVEWYSDSESIELHPIQKPLEPGERYSN